MEKLKTKRVCNKCKEPAKIWDKGQWWCSIDSSMGSYNMRGYCSKEKRK
tara:strand:+ start:470 stop:616 length:147 start_codon:yes stop_codon:yes gene_type:complete